MPDGLRSAAAVTPTWDAVAVSPDQDFRGAALLRGTAAVDQGHGGVARAVFHVTARGLVEAHLDGQPVTQDVLCPGWSSYEWRLRYRSHDVTDIVSRAGDELVMGLALGNGWFRGRLTWNGDRAFYGTELAGFAQLEVEFADGHRQVVGTDETWRSGPSSVMENDLYDGQTIDARQSDDTWCRPGFTADGWVGVHRADLDPATLEPAIGPPVTRQDEVPPRRIWTSPAGQTLVDFGQNLVGWVRVRVRGRSGDEVTLRHAEVLEDGELGVRPLRTAAATDRFILSGGDDVFEPTLTFHGFRYASVDGWPGGVDALERDRPP